MNPGASGSQRRARASSRRPLDLDLSTLGAEQRFARRRAGGSGRQEMQGVYIISVAARILAMHPQTLRKYERLGLVRPSRTVGMLRLYSERDIARLELIKYLVGDLGLNLAGVRMAMRLFNQLLEVRERLPAVQGQSMREIVEDGIEQMLATLRGSVR